LNLGLNMIFLPNGTWRTAVYTTLVSEVFLTSVLIVVAVTAARRERLSSDRQPVAT
jgi:hypothetical protein